jgi:hypothetical protein
MDESKEAVDAKEFRERVKVVKLDPEFAGYSGRISGLSEKSHWTFVCSEHTSVRLKTEEELKAHFKNNAHTRRVR